MEQTSIDTTIETAHLTSGAQRMRRNRRSVKAGRPVLLAAALAIAVALPACGGDDAANGDASGTATDTIGSGTAPGASVGAPTAAPLDTVYVPPPSTSEIRSQLAEKFDKMGGMDRVNIVADSTGVVTLSGTVKTSDRKQTAEDAAALVPGVVRVVNKLRVE